MDEKGEEEASEIVFLDGQGYMTERMQDSITWVAAVDPGTGKVSPITKEMADKIASATTPAPGALLSAGGWSTPTAEIYDVGGMKLGGINTGNPIFIATDDANSGGVNAIRVPTQAYMDQQQKKVRQAKDFLEMDVDSMDAEQLRKELNLTLIALEETNEIWEQERDDRIQAQKERDEALQLVAHLREVGFVGDADNPTQETLEQRVELERLSREVERERARKKLGQGGIISGSQITVNMDPGERIMPLVPDITAKRGPITYNVTSAPEALSYPEKSARLQEINDMLTARGNE